MKEDGKRYLFEQNPDENQQFVIRQAPPILGEELFSLLHKQKGIEVEVLRSQVFITSRELPGRREREYAMVVEMPFSSIRLEHLMRAIATESNETFRAVSSREIVERVNNLGEASTGLEDERWRIVEKHAKKFSRVLSGSGQAVFSSTEGFCARPEDILEDIVSGKFARIYRNIADNPPASVRQFLDRLALAIHNSAFIWNGKRVPPLAKIDRLFSRFEQISPGAKEAVVAQALDDFSLEEIDDIVSAHANDVLNAKKIVTENGNTAYVKGAQGVRVAALSERVATVISQDSMSQVSVRDGENGIEFDIRTKELGDSLLIPVIKWSKDGYGFRRWDLETDAGLLSAIIPMQSNKEYVKRSVVISTSQFDSLLGLMVFDLLHGDVREWMSKRFGPDKRFEHPAMSIMGALQRKDVLLESEVLKKAERLVIQNGKELS